MLLKFSARVLSLNQHIEPITLRYKSVIYNVYKCYSKDGAVDYFSELLQDRRVMLETEQEKNADKPPPVSKISFTQSSRAQFWFNTEAANQNSLSSLQFRNWWNHHRAKLRKEHQRRLYENYKTLGYDLTVSHFILNEGGRIKIKGHDNWIDKNNMRTKVPTRYDPNYFLVAIDIRDMLLEYEGLNNMVGLQYLQWLSLKGCHTIDDWSLDKLSAEFQALEYLDISECINVTERGLEALYRMPSLKKLIVTNFFKSAAFELTCMMLEDVNPQLTCEILMPKEELH